MSTCIFCEIVDGKLPSSKVYEDELCLAFMDIFPVSEGHVLIVPKEHQSIVHELSEELRQHLFLVASKIRAALSESNISCEAAHYLINDGKKAMQSVPHVHIHVIPRNSKDGISLVRKGIKKLSPLSKPLAHEKLGEVAEEIKKYL